MALISLNAACTAHADGAQIGPAWSAEITTQEKVPAVCTILIDGVRVRIEKLKTLSREWGSKIRDGKGVDASNKMQDERRTINDLNSMLTGIGCKPLNVEFELTQPPQKIPPAPAAKIKLGKHHQSG